MSQQYALATFSASADQAGVPELNEPTSTAQTNSTPSGHRPTPASPSESVQARRERLHANFGARAKGSMQRSISELGSRTLSDRTNLSGGTGDLFGQAAATLGKRTNRAESSSPSRGKIAKLSKETKNRWQRSKTHNFGQAHDLQHDFQTAKALLLEPPDVRVEGTDLVLEVADQSKGRRRTLSIKTASFAALKEPSPAAFEAGAPSNGDRSKAMTPIDEEHEGLLDGIDFGGEIAWSSPRQSQSAKGSPMRLQVPTAPLSKSAASASIGDATTPTAADVSGYRSDDELDFDEFGDEDFLMAIGDAELDADAFDTSTTAKAQRSDTPEVLLITDGMIRTGSAPTDVEPSKPIPPQTPQALPNLLPMTSGFTTGRGERVAGPSEEAMARAKALLGSSPPDGSAALSKTRADKGKAKERATTAPASDPPSDPSSDGQKPLPPETPGFVLASGKNLAPPTAKAVQFAKAKIAKYNKEWEEESALSGEASAPPVSEKAEQPVAATPAREQTRATGGTTGVKVFKPTAAPAPTRSIPTTPAPPSFASQTPDHSKVSAASFSTPVVPQISTPTSTRNLGSKRGRPSLGGLSSARRSKFKVPFKQGGETPSAPQAPSSDVASSSRTPLQNRDPPAGQKTFAAPQALSSTPARNNLNSLPTRPSSSTSYGTIKSHNSYGTVKAHRAVFDLNTPIREERISLEETGIVPEGVSAAVASDLGCPAEALQIFAKPQLAASFSFLGEEGNSTVKLGIDAALDELKSHRAMLIDHEWVTNHWSLILWKLAAVCRHVPHESNWRWSFKEVVRQLLYRYEREVNRAERSAVKRIQEHDSAAAQPMILCVYSIDRSRDGELNPDEEEQMPEVVLTDGWYFIKADIDRHLFLAIVVGKIKIGQKLAIVGARLQCSGDGTDVMRAFETSRLVINANGCHHARWHAKLGFTGQPHISTLRALCALGGAVSLMRIKITRLFPVAFVDIRPPPAEGEPLPPPPPPRNEADEIEAAAEWKRNMEDWQMKLQDEWSKRFKRGQSVCQQLQEMERQQKGKKFSDEATRAADRLDVDEVLDQMMASADAGALIRSQPAILPLVPDLLTAAKRHAYELQSTAQASLEDELNEKCPPRNVRSFRVIKFVDAYPELAHDPIALKLATTSTTREAQLTVWDAVKLEGELKVGKQFVVSNLVPTSVGSWRSNDYLDAEVFLATRRDSQWIPLPNAG